MAYDPVKFSLPIDITRVMVGDKTDDRRGGRNRKAKTTETRRYFANISGMTATLNAAPAQPFDYDMMLKATILKDEWSKNIDSDDTVGYNGTNYIVKSVNVGFEMVEIMASRGAIS